MVEIIFNRSNNFIINVLSRREIEIYKIKGNKFIIKYKDLDKVPSIYIVSYKRIGFALILDGIKKEKHFIISCFICVIIMVFLSNLIFEVDVLHDDKNIREIINEELTINGLKPVGFKKSYDEIDKIKTKIKEEHKNDIEWIEIIRSGMKYYVKIEERKIVNPRKDEEYCDVISLKDAIVGDSNIYNGEMTINRGDFVSKGSILINGKIDFKEETKKYTCADGIVYGNTWYKVNVNLPLNYEKKVYTGKKQINIAYENGNNYKEILNNHFKSFDVKKKYLFKIFNTKIYLEKVYEYNPNIKKYSIKGGLNKAKKLARNKMKIKLGKDGKITSEKVLQTKKFNSIMYIEFFYETNEPIGKKVIREIPLEGDEKHETTE